VASVACFITTHTQLSVNWTDSKTESRLAELTQKQILAAEVGDSSDNTTTRKAGEKHAPNVLYNQIKSINRL